MPHTSTGTSARYLSFFPPAPLPRGKENYGDDGKEHRGVSDPAREWGVFSRRKPIVKPSVGEKQYQNPRDVPVRKFPFVVCHTSSSVLKIGAGESLNQLSPGLFDGDWNDPGGNEVILGMAEPFEKLGKRPSRDGVPFFHPRRAVDPVAPHTSSFVPDVLDGDFPFWRWERRIRRGVGNFPPPLLDQRLYRFDTHCNDEEGEDVGGPEIQGVRDKPIETEKQAPHCPHAEKPENRKWLALFHREFSPFLNPAVGNPVLDRVANSDDRDAEEEHAEGPETRRVQAGRLRHVEAERRCAQQRKGYQNNSARDRSFCFHFIPPQELFCN